MIRKFIELDKNNLKTCHVCEHNCHETIQALLQLSDSMQMLIGSDEILQEYKSKTRAAYMIIHNEIFEKAINKDCLNIIL